MIAGWAIRVSAKNERELAMGVKLDIFAAEDNPRLCRPGEAIFTAFEMGFEMYVVLGARSSSRSTRRCWRSSGRASHSADGVDRPGAARGSRHREDGLQARRHPEKRFLFMVQQTPHFALQIMKVMADRLRTMNARL